MTHRYFSVYLVCLVSFLTGLTTPGVSGAQATQPVVSQEYFLRQNIDEDLLITINAFEAEFESTIRGANGEVLLLSSVPGSRIVPVFQYINAPKSARQLDILVTSSLHTGRTEFGIELTRLKPWDSRSSSLSRAYSLLSFGMEVGNAESEANWTVKIENLVNAGRLFQQLGMQEMRLWANYLAAHLIHFHLHDYSYVYSLTGEILTDLKGTRLQKIQLATLQLQSLALIGLNRSGSLSNSVRGTEQVQEALSRTAALAAGMGYFFEQARALYASGIEYAEQSETANALERFQQAVKAADSVGSAELAKAIRESIVQIHTIQGDAPATSEVLQEIETQLVEDGGGDELALNLLAQARLLLASYYHGESIEVLSKAMTYENNSAIRRQINFELATVLYQAGRLNESLDYLKLAGINAQEGRKRQGRMLIDVGEGLQIMANIYRMQADFERMQEARRAQGQYKPSPDQYFYDRGLDGIARGGIHRQQAAAFFKQSYTAAIAAGNSDLRHLAHLQYCVLAASGDVMCSKADLNASYQWLIGAGVPRFATQGMFLWAQLRIGQGRRSEAATVLDELVDKIHLMRHSLPGVLGAWYWERRESVFETWLGLLVANSRSGGAPDGSDSLLALSKIRHVESYTGSELVVIDRTPETDLLRDQLAQRAVPGAGSSVFALNDRINQGLGSLQASFTNKTGFLSHNGLQKYLRSLADDELVLTYHISPSMAQVWVAGRQGIERRKLANPAKIYSDLQLVQSGLENAGVEAFDQKMAVLGRHLLEPLADRLKENIFWIPSGLLLGLPVDALRVKGRYLMEKHRVVNLLSFPQNTDPGKSLQAGPIQSAFVAGNPQDYTGDYANRLQTSPEISAVANIYVGPGLQIIQGAALLPDEFNGGYFGDSSLIHLSMPGRINRTHPGESGLELSESEYAPGRMVLRPPEIRQQRLAAKIVFLSSTRVTETSAFTFSSRVGLVSDFAAAGARSIIANLWSNDAESNDGFITDFYHRLRDSGDVAESLHESRLKYLETSRENNRYDWAGYQLFIR